MLWVVYFIYLKETRNSYVFATPKNYTLHECALFCFKKKKKKQTKDIFHCLELITEILSFLQTFSLRKTTTQFF